MVSVQDWKTARCADTEDSDHIRAIEALASLLEGDTSPSEAAKAITNTYEPSLKAIEGPWKDPHWYHNKVTEFWILYMSNAIRSFGSTEKHERLFELLIEISRQPDLEDDDGMVVKSIHHKTFWDDLPGCAGQVANTLSDYESAGDFRPEERELFLAQNHQFLNATRFAAMMLSRNKFASGLPLYASYYLTIGLEHSYDEKSEDMARVDRDEWETLIPIATNWLSIAGKTIYEHCKDNDLYDGWNKGSWNLERWNLWKKQLGQFAEREDFNDECRGLALQTVKKMAEVEAEPQAEPLPSETCWPVDDFEDELRSSHFPVD